MSIIQYTVIEIRPCSPPKNIVLPHPCTTLLHPNHHYYTNNPVSLGSHSEAEEEKIGFAREACEDTQSDVCDIISRGPAIDHVLLQISIVPLISSPQ
jgi:hypothetical protein